MRNAWMLAMVVVLFAGIAAAQTADSLLVSNQPTDTMANANINNGSGGIVVQAVDSTMANAVDTSFTGQIDVVIQTGTGTLGGTTSVNAVAGEATFSDLNIDTIGAFTLRFTDNAAVLTQIDSSSFNITADRLVVVGGPANTTAGATIQTGAAADLTIEAQDGNGNTDTSFVGTVDVSIATGTGTLNGTVSQAAVLGVATFNDLSINEAGSFTLDFMDQGGNLTQDTSGSFDITPDVDAQLAFNVQPSNVAVNTNISPSITVEIQDQFGNLTASTAPVTLTIGTDPVGGTNLSGGAATAAVAGTATFASVQLDQVGTGFTLAADSTGLTQAISSSFDVTGAANSDPVLSAPDNVVDISVGGTDPNLMGTCVVGDDLQIRFTATDADAGDNLTITVADAGTGSLTAAGAGFTGTFPISNTPNPSPQNVQLAGTAATNGNVVLTVTVDDGQGGQDTYNIDITISSVATPTITVNSSMTAFSTTGTGIPSTEQSYTVSGSDLTADITVTPPTHFEISLTSGAGFGTAPINLTQTGGTVGNTTIFVRYNPSTSGSHNGNITHTSTGATQQDVAVTGSIAAPAAATVTAQNNPGSGKASPGSTKSVLGFRVTETGGGTPFTVTSVVVDIQLINNTGGVAAAAIESVRLVRGGTLGTVTNGGAGWSLVGSVVTVTFSGLSDNVPAGGTRDYSVQIRFTGSSVPTPAPAFQASLDGNTDVNGGTSISGATVTGGTITLAEKLPSDPFADDDDEDDCNLSTNGGPAWPMALLVVLGMIGAVAIRVRRKGSNL